MYTHITQNAYGCTHIETLDLTILKSTSHTTVIKVCDTYTWSGPLGNGTTYTASGIYNHVTQNADGCNHTETLDLTINNLILNTPSVSNVSCVGGNDGTASFSINNGLAPFAYAWSNGGSTAMISRLTAKTYMVTVTDNNTCTATQTAVVGTAIDAEKPIITCKASAVRNTNFVLCTYSAVGTEFDATATDNCKVASLTYVLSGATSGSGSSLSSVKFNLGATVVTWTATDGSNNVKTCSFTVTVDDDQNATGYIIYAANEVKFGEYNYINGNIGVTAADGKASFKKYNVLDPFSVKAKNIDVQTPSSVADKIHSPASDGPNPTFFGYAGNTAGLSNYTVSSNTTLSGNYKDLTIKKGVIATIQGNNFGKITVEEGAQVTFSSNVINLENLDIKGGKKDESTTNVFFQNPPQSW